MGTTALAGYPYPEGGEDPDGPLQIRPLAEAIERDLIITFPSTAARDAAITAPVNGQMARIRTAAGVQMTYYNGATRTWGLYWPGTVRAPAWVSATLGAGWTNYGTAFALTSYAKDAMGWVHVRGLVRNSRGANTSGRATPILTLPVGYRPIGPLMFVTQTAADKQVRVHVDRDGFVYPAQVMANGEFAFLDQISFYPEY